MTETTSRDTYRERVAKGAALLDKQLPDWRGRVDSDRLTWRNANLDILGQIGLSVGPRGLIDGSAYMTKQLRLRGWETISHGFDILESHDAAEWDVLADVWREHLSQQPARQ